MQHTHLILMLGPGLTNENNCSIIATSWQSNATTTIKVEQAIAGQGQIQDLASKD